MKLLIASDIHGSYRYCEKMLFTAMAVCAAIRPKPCSRPEAISMSAVSAESTDMMENWKNE